MDKIKTSLIINKSLQKLLGKNIYLYINDVEKYAKISIIKLNVDLDEYLKGYPINTLYNENDIKIGEIMGFFFEDDFKFDIDKNTKFTSQLLENVKGYYNNPTLKSMASKLHLTISNINELIPLPEDIEDKIFYIIYNHQLDEFLVVENKNDVDSYATKNKVKYEYINMDDDYFIKYTSIIDTQMFYTILITNKRKTTFYIIKEVKSINKKKKISILIYESQREAIKKTVERFEDHENEDCLDNFEQNLRENELVVCKCRNKETCALHKITITDTDADTNINKKTSVYIIYNHITDEYLATEDKKEVKKYFKKRDVKLEIEQSENGLFILNEESPIYIERGLYPSIEEESIFCTKYIPVTDTPILYLIYKVNIGNSCGGYFDSFTIIIFESRDEALQEIRNIYSNRLKPKFEKDFDKIMKQIIKTGKVIEYENCDIEFDLSLIEVPIKRVKNY